MILFIYVKVQCLVSRYKYFFQRQIMDYPSSANAYRFGIQDESVIIYVRNYAKRAIMIKTEKWLKTNHLKEKIYKKMRVPV